MYDIVALGEILIDFTPVDICGSSICFSQNPGGAPANVLAMISKLGGSTGFIGKVGNDQFGRFLKETLIANRIDAKGLVFSDTESTTLAFVHLSQNGERHFSFVRNPGADMMLTDKEVSYDMIRDCKVFHFGSVSLTKGTSEKATIEAIKYAKVHNKIISFDPNYREPLWDHARKAKLSILDMMCYSDIVKISHEEMEFLFEISDYEKCAAALKKMGVSFVIISLGEKGAFYSYKSSYGIVPGIQVDAVDTTCAGDAFYGSILYHMKDMSIEELKRVSKKKVEKIIQFANTAGALTTTKKGAINALPSLEDIFRVNTLEEEVAKN